MALLAKARKQHGGCYGLSWLATFIFLTSWSYSSLAITSPSHITTVQIGLIFEEPSPDSWQQYFLSLLSQLNNESLELHYSLKEIILKWDVGKPPLTNINVIKDEILGKNISVVYSFLASKSNDLLQFLMRDSFVPIVVIGSQSFQWTSENTVGLQIRLNARKAKKSHFYVCIYWKFIRWLFQNFCKKMFS